MSGFSREWLCWVLGMGTAEYSEGSRQRQASLFGYEKQRRLGVTWEFKTDRLIWVQPDGLIPSFGI